MENFLRLNKNEMKMVMGGETEPESVIGGEEDTAGKYPKIEACVGKAHGDSCIFTYKNYNYSGKCTSHIASERYCSTLL